MRVAIDPKPEQEVVDQGSIIGMNHSEDLILPEPPQHLQGDATHARNARIRIETAHMLDIENEDSRRSGVEDPRIQTLELTLGRYIDVEPEHGQCMPVTVALEHGTAREHPQRLPGLRTQAVAGNDDLTVIGLGDRSDKGEERLRIARIKDLERFRLAPAIRFLGRIPHQLGQRRIHEREPLALKSEDENAVHRRLNDLGIEALQLAVLRDVLHRPEHRRGACRISLDCGLNAHVHGSAVSANRSVFMGRKLRRTRDQTCFEPPPNASLAL